MTGQQASTTVGARLREAREKRGLSLRQIAERTRISVMSLKALERNEVRRLPGGIFTRAFVRSYAAEVGLDPEQTVEEFLGQFPSEPLAEGRRSRQVEDNQAIESDRRMAETVMRLVLVSIPIAGFVIYLGLQRPSPESLQSEPQPAAVTTGAETTPADVAEAPAATPGPASSGGLAMVIEPRADCWISPTIDGEKVPSELLGTGQRRELTARKEIMLTVGDGGACTYTLNGVTGRPLGASGKVVTRRINLDNYRSYLVP
jgi:cytoskeleton protein RodZ